MIDQSNIFGRLVSVYLFDGQRLARDSMSEFLRSVAPDLDVTAYDDTGFGADAGSPDVAVVNLGGSSLLDPPSRERVRRLREALPVTPLLVLSGRCDVAEVVLAFSCGAHGLMPAAGNIRILVAAIHLLASGGVYVAEPVLRSLLDSVAAPPAFTQAPGLA